MIFDKTFKTSIFKLLCVRITIQDGGKTMNKKFVLQVLCMILFIAASASGWGGQNERTKSPALVWRDAETKVVLFTSDDLISFDWDKQVFLLKRDATLDFLAWIPPHMHQARKLSVEDAQGRIQEAHWVSDSSSRGFSGPIYTPLSPNPFFSIVNGAPVAKDTIARNKDPRFGLRLRTGLEKAGVLQTIDLNKNYLGLIIQTTGYTWKDVGKDMKIRVQYFKNTFRLGGKARAHIFFAGGRETRKQIDSVTFKVKFIANKGTFISDIIMGPIPVSETETGIHVCKFAPWEPAEGSDKEAGLGSGKIYLTVFLQKQDNTMYRLDFPESSVPIGGRIQTEPKDALDKK